jgi:hypothetical protein
MYSNTAMATWVRAVILDADDRDHQHDDDDGGADADVRPGAGGGGAEDGQHRRGENLHAEIVPTM